MASWRAWLALGRPHTASLTIPGVLIGGILGGATPAHLVLLGAWALLFHYVGFLHNNLSDLAHDRRDPAKQHFPLVAGLISAAGSTQVFVLGTGVGFLVGRFLIRNFAFGDLESGLALFFLSVAYANGIAYNLLSKRTLLAPLLICTSFASLPTYAYFAAGGRADASAVWFVAAYAFAMMLHQIAWSGYLKDLTSDPVNLLHRLGARALPSSVPDRYEYHLPRAARLWGATTRLLVVGLAAAWLFGIDQTANRLFAPALVLACACGLVLWLMFQLTAERGLVLRRKKLKAMSVGEIAAYWLLVAVLVPEIGVPVAGGLIVAPIVWFVAMNYVLWGVPYPRV